MTKKIAAPNPAGEVSAYLAGIARIRQQGETKELTYRGELQSLLRNRLQARIPGCDIVHEPERQKCGAPDFAVKKSGVAVGFVEAKKIGADLNAAAESEQLQRYRAALPNLVLTNHLEFRHYADEKSEPVAVAKIANAAFRKNPDGVRDLVNLLNQFADLGESGRGESPDPQRLARIMAGKTRLLRNLVEQVAADPESELAKIHQELGENLIRGLKLPDFADIFAQTAAYGLFAARLEFEKLESRNGAFTRSRAGELLPQTTPFLRRFFNAFAGPDMDARISWMADDIAKMFAAVSLDNVARAFAVGGGQADDPFLHFYETFLREYDPEKRQARGVYFTPRPVADFIVRAVDDSLKSSFAIPKGLADNGMVQFNGKETHRVQILDPAAGTGAFLARIAERVRERVRRDEGEGAWPEYIRGLLARLNGFENMTSAYAMCHLKMALTIGEQAVAELAESVRRGDTSRRVNVFLADALQMPETDMGSIGALSWLWDEARAANRVKTEAPVMVVVGNPPYNVSSQNRGEWISKKLEDYKRGLEETNIRPLSDDYIKFIRNAEHFIEKNGRGVVAMITNNSFYDGLIHRQMRRHLLGTFDQIRILNLRGNTNIGERAPDGGPDKNVFDIKQGVGIFIMAKTGKKAKGKNARVFYAELQGGRKMKHDFLLRKSVASVRWRKLSPASPNFFFVPKNFSGKSAYEKGVSVGEIFRTGLGGVKTSCDNVSVQFDRASLEVVIDNFRNLPASKLPELYPQQEETSAWTFRRAKEGLRKIPYSLAEMCYRPFDIRHSIAAEQSGGFIGRPRHDVMRHLIHDGNVGHGGNVALLTTRSFPRNQQFTSAFVSRHIVDIHAGGGMTYVFPLWVWEEEICRGVVRRANFCADAASAFAKRMGMAYSEDGGGKARGVVSPEDLFDYIYAALHRPSYRWDYREFLRIDYPRIPAAADAREFRRMAKLGGELRELHLLESPLLDDAGHPFSAEGKNIVEAVSFLPDGESGGELGRVVINKAGRHFAGVPRAAWDFCVGGYHPARLWLKKRAGRSLSYADQRHYRRLLAALARTAELVGRLEN